MATYPVQSTTLIADLDDAGDAEAVFAWQAEDWTPRVACPSTARCWVKVIYGLAVLAAGERPTLMSSAKHVLPRAWRGRTTSGAQ